MMDEERNIEIEATEARIAELEARIEANIREVEQATGWLYLGPDLWLAVCPCCGHTWIQRFES
jgi:hypothetical protein